MYVLCGRCYEEGSTGSMAEENGVSELEELENQLQTLLSRYTCDELRADSKPFCSDFCKVVKEFASRWQVPLPQLRILNLALCFFARASTVFTSNCEHVLQTISSLALSVFELLLFFDQKDLHHEPLKQFTVTFQECSLALARHQNVHLLQVERLVRESGPWASLALQAILSGSILPQSEVDGCISSELPVFFELRLRYLLSCERVSEAMALAKCCAWHPTAGQHLFFLQVYLTWLLKTSQHDILHKEVADLNGKYAVHIICSLECEEQDDLLLALSRVFLCEQLCRGDMYYLCDLVFIWSKLHHRLKTPQNILLEEIRQLMLSATNVNSIFPFIRAILQEVGEDGIQFCIELCVNALECCLPCDVITKSLIYKTIAGLLPNDLEVCRACALLIFFVEHTVDAYKTVYLLYMHPDQEYPVENSPIRNHIRFETLQVLKKDLCFDPEFWNLVALRTSCLRMMTEKVVSSALEELMEDKWILNYCTKEPALISSTSVCQKGRLGAQAAKKRCQKEDRHKTDSGVAPKRLKLIPRDRTAKRKRNPSSQTLKGTSPEPLRRSFWQLDRLKDNRSYEDRRVTRLSEKNPPKRRIRTPKWLLEDSGTLEKNNVPSKIKRHRLKHQKHLQSSANKRSETDQIKNNGKDSPCLDSDLLALQTYSKHQKDFSLDCLQPASPPQVILELSLPDNELMDAFTEDTCNRQRGLPQVLLYKPTVKLPAATQPVKNVHRREVILRARDATMFVQQLHSYTRQLKGKGNGSNVQGSVSTITRSSVQGSPPKGPQKRLGKKPIAEKKDLFVFPTAAEVQKCPLLEQDLEAQTIKTDSQKTSSGREHSKMSAELKGTVASRSAEVAEMTESPVLLEPPQDVITEQVLQTSTVKHPDKAPAELKVASVSQIPAANKITEAPVLEEGRKAETKEHCEESTVEMKVTIASQTSTANKMNESPGLDKVSKAHTVKNLAKPIISDKISTASFSLMEGIEIKPPVNKMPNISNIAIADSNITHSQKAVLIDKKKTLELSSRSSQCEADCPEVVPTVNISIFDTSAKLSDGHLPLRKDTGAQGATSLGSDCKNSISALRFGTEMGTKSVPETQASKESASEVSVLNESTYGSKPNVLCKSHTTSSSPVPEQGFCAFADVQGKKGSDDFVPETSENREPVESEESKLEFCCTFCKKVFNGSRVVAHAMFHFRKDECMFCGTIFKDDLLAMMHLSDHIEKLKKNKDSAGNKVQERQLSDTKDISAPKTSSKANTIKMSATHHRRGRPRKISVCNKSVSLPDSSPSGPRNLRSSVRSQACPSLQEDTQNASKNLDSSTPGRQINGHMAKKKVLERLKMVILNSKAKQPRTPQEKIIPKNDGSENPKLQESKDVKIDAVLGHVDQRSCCSTTGKDVAETMHVLNTSTKHNGKTAEEKIVEPQEKLCCPVDGCTWFTDLSKNRVALLYHALEDHCGDIRPLELAFRIGNSKCSICMRVLWSFEHFQHHVERHRLAPRHPCLHQGCTARFKTGIEMRRHTRRHSPLQAMCCLPGCSQLFICLWALNLHEREHYASKPTKPDKSSNKQTHDKSNMPSGKKQQDPNDKNIAVDENISVKAARQSTGEAAYTASEKHINAFSAANGQTSLMKPEVKESSDSHVLKNLSNKDTSAQSTGPTLRMRHNVHVTDTSQKYNTALKSHKFVSSSLLKHRIRVRNKFKRKQIKMNKIIKARGRPPKSKKVVHDENTTGQDSKTVKAERDQRSQAPLECPSHAAETSNVSKTLKESENIQVLVKTTEMPIDDSKSKKLINKKLKKKSMKQIGKSHNASTTVLTESSEAEKTQKANIVKSRKLHKAKKCLAPKESIYTPSETTKSKKLKVISDKTKMPYPLKEEELVMSNSLGPQVETKTAGTEENCDGEEKRAENVDSMQKLCDELPAPPTNSGAQTTEKSKKLHSTQQPALDSKTNKEKTCKNKGDKTTQKQPGKDASKTSLKGAVESGSVDHQVEATDSSPSILKEFSPPSIANGENRKKATTKKKSKKTLVMKNTDANKASMKHKVTKGETKVANKRCKDQGAHKRCKKPEVKGDVLEASEVEEGKSSVDTSQSVRKRRRYSLKMNGQAATEDKTSTLCIETLAEYGKKPYMRPPPTAYLDEKYTTMPKRRKEMTFCQLPERVPQQEEARATLQRQRCANCFATFSSPDDLQMHHHLHKCSNLFGFDSDDEGNG